MAKGKYQEWLEPDGLLKLEAWARDGLTDEQIATNVGISAKTLYDWKKKYSKICKTLKRGKEVVDIIVENSLLKRAIGYQYEEKKVEHYLVEGVPVEKVTVTTKEVVPDVTAQIFWLKNRKPESWQDKKDLAHSGSVDVKRQYEDMEESELQELIKRYEKINKT